MNAILLSNKGNFHLMPNLFRSRIDSVSLYCSQNLGIFQKKNDTIYKHKVFEEKFLPAIPNLNEKIHISPIEPPFFTKPFEYENIFDQFLDSKSQQIILEIQKIVEKSKDEIEKASKDFFKFKEETFNKNSVNFLIDFNPQISNQNIIPPVLNNKRKRIFEMGSKEKLFNLLGLIKDNSANCGMILENCLEKLDKEKNEDKSYKEIYQNMWTRTPSEVASQGYYFEINSILFFF